MQTTINVSVFNKLLTESNYDTAETKFLIKGLTEGFDLNYTGPRNVKLKSPNLRFTVGDKFDLWGKMMKEVKLKRFAGPFKEVPFKDFFIQSPVGLVPKDGGTKTRLIFHLSYPRGTGKSVNENTPYDKCRVQYKDFDHAIRRCLEELARGGCYLGKSDLTSAFRILGIRPEDWPLLVMKAVNPQDNQTYYFVDKCLPFGHAMSCALFQRMSDAMEWVLRHRTSKESINYLDDFFFADVLKKMCNNQVATFLQLCDEINFPYSVDKTYWASTKLVFLGLLIDVILGLVCVPVEKVERARCLILEMLSRKKRKVKLVEIQKLAGYLNFLCRAVLPGRAFTRRLYFAAKGLIKPHHHTKLKRPIVEDLKMWLKFLNHGSVYCRSFLDFGETVNAHRINFYTDATRNFTLGAGGVCNKSWYYLRWNKKYMERYQPSIEYLELYAVVVAVVNWIDRFSNQRVIIFCDNISVVYMINRNTSSCEQCLALIRILVLKSMVHNVRVFANYVNTKSNTLADLLSRQKVKRFKKLVKGLQYDTEPTPVPEELWPMHKLWQ